MSENDSPARGTILQQAEQIAADSPEGFVAGVVVENGNAGAEVSVKADVGEPGGWSLAATGRWMKNAGRSMAGLVRWEPKSGR